MSSSSSAPAAPKDAPTEAPKDEAKAQPTYTTALEEDDEFEEFPVQDWDASETELNRLGKGEQAAGASGQKIADSLWEDNWDDDDIEEDFSAQLRNELAKAKPTSGVEPMQH
ncbi:hypothetical protein EXIGLDRAFT_770598 [Exidia glandulosa HHB12029]|uniref:26S proteasome complex subunit SEM1 n=1 Tax=Exidia glandulosa HHB12029 TaxID=1314781 RepID=A0A165GJT0_EXIGL|nr:hypothetical protein EXIGLDRAFT_323953 [Exidia glandulosa HHB12029]KZV90630.1 hypothetical protein EXIGLDRAFT_770598 [Exidia glandulosa HHB12029]